MRSWVRRVLVLAVFCGVVWAAGAASLDRYGRRTVSGHYDAIIVAGCRVDPDGSPSKALARRTRLAVDLWHAGVADTIVFTGGVGRYPPSEAVAAADYARTLGVPDDRLVLEDRSTSTEENARFAAEVLDPGARVVVVTDTYHVFRSERVFSRVFASADGAGSVPRLDVRLRGAFREVGAVFVYGVRGRL